MINNILYLIKALFTDEDEFLDWLDLPDEDLKKQQEKLSANYKAYKSKHKDP